MNPLLKSYFPVADIIAGTFGEHCEVVVHDLTRPENSAVYVANGNVTGRQVGQSFDHLVKQVLMNKNFHDDHVINYMFEGKDSKMIKSSSALLRDEKDEVIGMMCINYDTTFEQQVFDKVSHFLGNNTLTEPEIEEVDQDVSAILDDLIKKIIGTSDVKKLPRKNSVELIKFMDDKGIFLVKGSIDKVAALMGVSRVTIYSYLDEAKGKR